MNFSVGILKAFFEFTCYLKLKFITGQGLYLDKTISRKNTLW